MTRDEINLLLYFETCAVDHGGLVRESAMNCDDQAIAEAWSENSYAMYERVQAADHKPGGASARNHVVTLSNQAFEDAHRLRRERADRQFKNRTRLTVAEARAAI
ncbi:hypothetical protein [Labrenzia sp. DG1229]|uniref:hypothetical protein n=1 Tax=Labrenzia sp. DG1229 TaxID=681847 RepID=UPI000490D6BD|nr:hypothetical protein [Labrenzia sp. DG1229]